MSGKYNYTWKVWRGLPGDKPIIQFPHDTEYYYREGVVVEVFPENGESWIGNFQGESPSSRSLVTKSPIPGVIYVNTWANGYFVDVTNPSNYKMTEIIGIRKIFEIPVKKILILQGIENISAYNENGLLWVTERFGHGDNVIREITDDEVIGGSWVPWENQYVEFKVNLQTGELDVPDCARRDYLDKL